MTKIDSQLQKSQVLRVLSCETITTQHQSTL